MRRSSIRTASRARSRPSRASRRAHVHLHALPAAGVLSADGSALRRDSEDASRARRRSPTCGCVTVTLDPAFDTPGRAEGARTRGVKRTRRSGRSSPASPTEVNKFASQFGLYVEHNPQNAIDITHNLRTAVIDPDGRLVNVHSGNSWTPAELVADLSAAPAPAH